MPVKWLCSSRPWLHPVSALLVCLTVCLTTWCRARYQILIPLPWKCVCPWVWLTECSRLSCGTTAERRETTGTEGLQHYKAMTLKAAVDSPSVITTFCHSVFGLLWLRHSELHSDSRKSFTHFFKTTTNKLPGTPQPCHPPRFILASSLVSPSLLSLLSSRASLEKADSQMLCHADFCCAQWRRGSKRLHKALSFSDAWHNLSPTEGMFVWGGLLKCHFLCSQHQSHSACPPGLDSLFGLSGHDYF